MREMEEGYWREKREGALPVKAAARRVRVAIVAASRRFVGGQSVQAELLIRQWKNDPDVEAHFIPVDPELPGWLAWAGHVPFLRTLLRQPFYVAAVWRGLTDAEVAHIFSASYFSFLLGPLPAWLIARLRRRRALINYHSGEARDHLRRSRIARAVLRRADRLVVPSMYLVDVFREFGLGAHPVPNIFDSHQFEYRPRDPLRPWLLCTRGFHAYYGVDLAVRAFALIKQEFPEARLCLVGGGPQEATIRALVRDLNLADVKFTGAVSHEQIGRFYDESDIFINASWLDNLPISILEAFASGAPVVTTSPDGIRYLVEHERTGLRSDPGDWQALAANVLRLLREPTLARQIARNAFEESRRYRWDAVRNQWLEIYRSLEPHLHLAPVGEDTPSNGP